MSHYDGGPMARIPASQEEGRARERELKKDYQSSQERKRRMGLFGGKQDTRPVDEGLAKLKGSDENTAIEFWKKRLELTAAVPNEIARTGALTPQLRELSRIEDQEERKRLTRARIIAFAQLSSEQRQVLAAARQKAFTVDPEIANADEKLVNELLPTVDEKVRAVYPSR